MKKEVFNSSNVENELQELIRCNSVNLKKITLTCINAKDKDEDYSLNITTHNPKKIMDILRKESSISKYQKAVDMGSLEVKRLELCPVKVFVNDKNFTLAFFKSGDEEHAIKIEADNPSVDKLFILVRDWIGELPISAFKESMNKVLNWVDEIPSLPLIECALAEESTYSFIPEQSRSAFAKALYYYFWAVILCSLKLLEYLFDSDANFSIKPCGAFRVYYPKYGGTRTFEFDFVDDCKAMESDDIFFFYKDGLKTCVTNALRYAKLKKVDADTLHKLLSCTINHPYSGMNKAFSLMAMSFWKSASPMSFENANSYSEGSSVMYIHKGSEKLINGIADCTEEEAECREKIEEMASQLGFFSSDQQTVC